jgi:hypothetical protein
MANIGQLKAVFALRFETLAAHDHDGDGMPDWWEIEHGLDPADDVSPRATPSTKFFPADSGLPHWRDVQTLQPR